MKSFNVSVPEEHYDAVKAKIGEVGGTVSTEVKADSDVYKKRTKEEVLESLRRGLEEVREIRAGRMEAIPIQKVLDELRD